MQDKNNWSRSIFIVMLTMLILIGSGCETMRVSERAERTGSAQETSIETEMATMETVFDDFSIQIENIEDLLDDKVIGVVRPRYLPILPDTEWNTQSRAGLH